MVHLLNRFLLIVLAVAWGSGRLAAEEGETEKTVRSPSPDGRFAFLLTHGPDTSTVDLIEKRSKKVLLRVAESEDDSNELTVDTVLWRPDGQHH